MTVPAASSERPWTFGVAALALTLAAWLWFVVCFTARSAAWWNSLWLFTMLYAVAILLALRGLKSWLSVLALVIAALSLACVALFLFGDLARHLLCVEHESSNQTMKPTAPLRYNFRELATTLCRGLSFSL